MSAMGRVILFARAPRLGAGKKRLAADIGRVAAWRFARGNLLRMTDRLKKGPWSLTVRVADAADLDHPAFDGLAVQPQKGTDLGARMRDALTDGTPSPTLIVGSDIPEIQPHHLSDAFDKLRRADAVFGPSPDGGYWLVGLSGRLPVPRLFMSGVRWSTRHALADTLHTLPRGATVAWLDMLDDVDDGPSYRAYLARGGRCR